MDTHRFSRPALIATLSLVLACQQAGASATSPTPTATPVASASVTPKTPAPTPISLTITGHVTRAPDGAPVAGVRLRFAPFAINDGRQPGPDVTVTSDATGAYNAKIAAWTLEALADSSSSQLSLFVTPPAGMKVVAVTRSSTVPIGPLAPNDPQWYFMLARELDGAVDITLAAQ
jgi:hypothetical protein